jgi:hypothetical protein
MQNSEIQQRVINTLGLQTDTSFSESGFTDQLIYEGICDILARTHAAMRVIVMGVTANTAVHDMSQQVIQLLDIKDDGGFLERYSREDISKRQTAGLRGYCWEEPLLWISPIQSSDFTVEAYGVFRPVKMTGATDNPAQPNFGGLAPEFHPTIVTYCLWKAGEYMQHEQSGGGERWRQQYEGQDGLGGEVSKIKRIAEKRVTPRSARRRSPTRNMRVLPSNADWVSSA